MEVEAGPARRTRLLFLVIAAYGFAHLLWYWHTPFGQTAVLDERENLQLAEQIVRGELPREPFYRAMIYPVFLAVVRVAGVPSDWMPQAATALGLGLHLLCAWLAAAAARRWFASPVAGQFGLLIYGLNPVLLHHATQIIDGTLANVFFFAGCALLPVKEHEATARRLGGFAAMWSLAALTRPQFLPLFLVSGFVWWLVTRAQPSARPRRLLTSLAIAGGVGGSFWLVQAGANWSISGRAWFLPWQGAYNLWAANKPGAHGAYYAQTMAFEENIGPDVHENPARRESVELYRRETGREALADIQTFNAHWRAKLREHLAREPLAWAQLQGRKAYYLLNDYEQYNNKTYAFHRRESPWLRYNPLGWGVLLVTALGGAIALRRQRPSHALAITATVAAIAGGVGLFYVSSRFRIPLLGLLCIGAAGTIACARAWWPATGRARAIILGAAASLAAVTFSWACDVRDESTIVQDRLLLAQAANRIGDDRTGWNEARAVLESYPQRRDVLRLAVLSYCNLLLGDDPTRTDEAEWLGLARRLLSLTPNPARDEPELPIAALALWRAGDEHGLELWRENYALTGSLESLAALVCVGAATEKEHREALAASPHAAGPWLRIAQSLNSANADAYERVRAKLFRRRSAARDASCAPLGFSPWSRSLPSRALSLAR